MYNNCRFIAIIVVFIASNFSSKNLSAQIKTQPYSYSYYQKFNDILYAQESNLHTSAKPFVMEQALLSRLDSLQANEPTSANNWFMRKIFNEHLVQVEKADYTFYADFLPDFQMGKDLRGDKRKTWLNTRGFQAGLSIGDKFSFYTNFFENQSVFPQYLDDYINQHQVVPGQSNPKFQDKNVKDWMYSTASLTYDFSTYFQATVAYDKNFIGDGYRSLLLSDFSSNYTNIKFSGTIGNVRYTSMWAYMNDPSNPRVDSLGNEDRYGNGKKWGAFQYVDWNINKKISLGFFQSIIWANHDAAGYRGFDFSYLSPLIFLRPVENNNTTSPDKMFLGANAKYKFLPKVSAYGQFLLGEFTAKEFFAGNGYAHNKWGAQFGLRGFDAFGVKKLNFLTEYNLVRPYTYQHFSPESNYSNNSEPLAHPMGANFRELMGMVNYSWKRFDFALQGNYIESGLDWQMDLIWEVIFFNPIAQFPISMVIISRKGSPIKLYMRM